MALTSFAVAGQKTSSSGKPKSSAAAVAGEGVATPLLPLPLGFPGWLTTAHTCTHAASKESKPFESGLSLFTGDVRVRTDRHAHGQPSSQNIHWSLQRGVKIKNTSRSWVLRLQAPRTASQVGAPPPPAAAEQGPPPGGNVARRTLKVPPGSPSALWCTRVRAQHGGREAREERVVHVVPYEACA